MKLHSLNRTKLLLVAACVSLGLAGLGFSALEVSPGHLRLIHVLQDDARTSRDNLKPVVIPVGFTTVEPAAVSVAGEKAISAAVAKVYRQPDESERELLLAGLADRVRSMPVGDFVRDQAALAGYFELREKTGATMLAGVDSLAELLPVPEDAVIELEPNGDWELSQQLVLGDTLSGTGMPFDDIDVFKFEAEAGQYVRIEALPLETDIYGMGYVIVRLFAPDSTQVQGGFYTMYEDVGVRSADVSGRLVWPGGNLVAASLDVGGTYYVVVETYPGDIRWLDSGMQVQGEGGYDEIAYRLTVNTLATSRVDAVVLDDRGGPVEGAIVQFWSYDGVGGARAVTGSDGSFVENLPAGTWGVNIEGPEGGPFPSGQPQQQFSFKGGDVVVSFELARGVVFSGRVETSRGEVAPNVGFSLIDADKGQYRWGQSGQDGSFSMAVFPGTFSIHLHTGYIYPPQPVTDSVSIASDTSSYVITLEAGYRVSGRLLDADMRALAGTRISFYGDIYMRTVYTSEDGSYGLNLLEGTYQAEVWPDAQLLVPQQTAGPYEITADTELDIQLARGGIIGGTVYDDRGNPVEGAQVNLWTVENRVDPGIPSDSVRQGADGVIYFEEKNQDGFPDLVEPSTGYSYGSSASMSRYYNFRTDSSGQWRTALLAGEYAVDVAAPHPYPSQRIKVGVLSLTDGSQVDAGRVEVAYGVLFSGTVMLDASTPLAWSGFNLVPVGSNDIGVPESDFSDDYGNMVEPGRVLWIFTDEKGEFSVQVVPGAYDLMFDPRNSQPMFPRQWVRGLTLEADTRKDITLEAGHVVSGRVVSESGEKLESSRLNFFESTGAWRAAVFSGSDGEFTARLSAGEYNMIISPAKGYFPDSSSYALSIDSDIQIEVVLRAGVRVHGRVTASDGHPLGGITVQLVPHFSWPSDSLADQNKTIASFASYGTAEDASSSIFNPYYPVGPPYPVERGQFVGYSDSDGYWEMIVRSGSYDIFASPSFGGYANALLPNLDCSRETEVNLVLEQTEIVFGGMVTDKGGHPAPGTLVSLFDPKNGDHVSAYTDDAGRFQIDLPMGDYEVFIEGPSGSGELPTSEHLKLDSDTEVTIELGSGLLRNTPAGPSLPRAFALSQNSPNPFNPSTTISYALEQQAQVSLAVYDLRGRTVAVLVDRVQDEGDYDIQWNGKDRSGRQLSSGVYMYRLRAGEFQMTRKMVLLK